MRPMTPLNRTFLAFVCVLSLASTVFAQFDTATVVG